MGLGDKFKEAFDKKYKLQMIGTALLIAAVVLLLQKAIVPCYIVLAVCLGIDLYLAYKDKKEGMC